MRTIVKSAAIAIGALLAASISANADVSGSVNVTGNVTAKCTVTAPTAGSTFGGTIPLGELDDASSGKISSSLTGSTISGASLTFTVVCNTAKPTVTLSATPLGDGVTAPSTYTSTVDYTAQLDMTETTGSDTFKYATYGTPSATTGTLTNPLSGTTGNVVVSVNSLETDGGSNTSILTAGSYGSAAGGTGGVISITIAP